MASVFSELDRIGKCQTLNMGLSENVGLIFPMIASHLKTGFHDQQNHWVQWGTLFSDTPMCGEELK